MTIAELHGKLSPEQERMEDLLTSDVFGTMRYAGWAFGFLDWIRTATSPPQLGGTKPIDRILPSSSIATVHYAFWPLLPNNREPDLALLFDLVDGRQVLLVIEVKFLSSMSDFEVAGELDEFDRTGNQIADQVKALEKVTASRVAGWFGQHRIRGDTERVHLLITREAALPVHTYRVACQYIAPPWPVAAFWLSWSSLAGYLGSQECESDPGRAALIEDLLGILRRKGLVPYKGFEFPWWVAPLDRCTFWQESWWNLNAPSNPVYWSFWKEAPRRQAEEGK